MILTPRHLRLKFTLRGLLWLMALAAAAALLLRLSRQSETRNRSLVHLREIADALRTMETTSGDFPRTAWAPSTGQPAHSWRALAAPLIRYREKDYNFHGAWDAPENRRGSDIFTWDESPPDNQASITNVLGIVGPEAAFDAERAPLILRDGIKDLICALEVRDSGVFWTQPADLDYRDFAAGRDVSRLGASDVGFGVIFLDGAVWLLRGDTPRDLLVRLMTIEGANAHDRDVLLEKFRVP